MTDTAWGKFVKKNRGRDNNTETAAKLGINGSTVGRWINGGSVPDVSTAVRFAHAYGQSVLGALIAAGHISRADIEREVSVTSTGGLDDYSTDTLLREISERLEVMGDYAGWVRAIATGGTSPAGLGVDVLRFIDPFTAPAETRGEDFLEVLAPHLEVAGEFEGATIHQLRDPRDVGGGTEDLKVARKRDPDSGEDPQ